MLTDEHVQYRNRALGSLRWKVTVFLFVLLVTYQRLAVLHKIPSTTHIWILSSEAMVRR